MKNYYCWCWKLGSEYPEWTGELVISGDFPAQSVCKKIRYCCFSHSTPVAADGRRWVHETPLFPPESAVSLCLFSVSLCFFLNRVIQWSSVSECTACTYGCLSAHIHIWMCVFQFFFFFFFWLDQLWFTCVCWDSVGPCGFLPPDFWFSPSSPCSIPYRCPHPLYRPCCVDSVEDVWLNILRPAD